MPKEAQFFMASGNKHPTLAFPAFGNPNVQQLESQEYWERSIILTPPQNGFYSVLLSHHMFLNPNLTCT